MESLSGKIAVVSGASGFVGQEIVRTLEEKGVNVVSLYRTTPPSLGVPYQCDLDDISQVQCVFEAIEQEVGEIAICVHVAGTKGSRKKLFQEDEADFRKEVSANIFSSFNFLTTSARTLKAHGKGVIIGITTIGVMVPEATSQLGGYTAAKFAVHGMLTQLHEELSTSGVRVHSVAPGFMAGGMNSDIPQAFVEMLEKKSKQGKLTTPSDVAEVVVKLCAEKQDTLTIPVAREYDMYAI